MDQLKDNDREVDIRGLMLSLYGRDYRQRAKIVKTKGLTGSVCEGLTENKVEAGKSASLNTSLGAVYPLPGAIVRRLPLVRRSTRVERRSSDHQKISTLKLRDPAVRDSYPRT